MGDRSRGWCFTLNNPTDDEIEHITEVCNRPDCEYAIVGREVGESGTPHLQGYILFRRRFCFRPARRLIGHRVHCERALGSPSQNRSYCSKGGVFHEFGTIPPESSQGKRSDLDAIFEWATQVESDTGKPPSSPQLARQFPSAYCRYPRIRLTIERRAEPVRFDTEELREWQSELRSRLDTDPDDRIVDFVLDEEGGKGKSWFCRYLFTMYPEEVQLLGVGKRDDIAHMVDESRSIFLFNVPRDSMEFFQYSIVEMLKDRVVVSPKYASRVKMLRRKCHVVVFCNEEPDMNKMSADRYNIIRI